MLRQGAEADSHRGAFVSVGFTVITLHVTMVGVNMCSSYRTRRTAEVQVNNTVLAVRFQFCLLRRLCSCRSEDDFLGICSCYPSKLEEVKEAVVVVCEGRYTEILRIVKRQMMRYLQFIHIHIYCPSV